MVIFSVIVPARNEEKIIAQSVERIRECVAGLDCEIIVAEDGSTDGTAEAVRNAMRHAEGEVLAYIDADLAPDPKQLPTLLEKADECDVVAGSRFLPESVVERGWSREVPSAVYNFIAHIVLNSRVADHQCGFKAMRRKAFEELDALANANHWFWDTEILVFAQKKGMRVCEMPIKWAEKDGRKSKVMLVRDSLGMLAQIIALRVRLWKQGIIY